MIYIEDDFLDNKLLNSLNENFLFDFEKIEKLFIQNLANAD